MPFWLKKENILNFWIPRFLVCLLIYFFYSNSQLSQDPSRLYYGIPTQIPDFSKYSVHLKFNPLFSFILQKILKLNQFAWLVKLIISQLISGISCIYIFKFAKENFSISKVALLIMAVHPFLALYSLKFTTENFCLLSIAIYFKFRKSINYEKFSIKRKFKNIFLATFNQFILFCLRAQNLPIFLKEFQELISAFLKKNNNEFKSNFRLRLFITFLFISLFLSIVLFITKDYLVIIPRYLWSGPYIFRPKYIYEYFQTFLNYENILLNCIIFVFSYCIYLIFSLFLLTGARERLYSGTWKFDLGPLSIENIISDGISPNIFIGDYKIEFLVKVVLPLILFSTIHLIGLIFWLKNFNRKNWQITIYPLSIIILPILFNPLLRYYIPIIPLSCIGISSFLQKFQLKTNH